MRFVPVVSLENKPLMPTIPSRARKWIKSGKATPFFKKGIFCVRLNKKPSDELIQPIAIGVDSGIKKEAFTVKSKSHTYLNIQSDSINYVKRVLKSRKKFRHTRRYRKCPYRKCRRNRATLFKSRINPSIKVRYDLKLKILSYLNSIFPIAEVVVEDIAFKTEKNTKISKRNKSFSPLQIGKTWFYKQIQNIVLKNGYETKALRERLNLIKSKNKLANNFNAHCVDSWVLANSSVGGDTLDNKEILFYSPIIFRRRQLFRAQVKKNNKRFRYGGTLTYGLKKGSIIIHTKFGLTYIGGSTKSGISLHNLKDGKRIYRGAKLKDCKFICYNSLKFSYQE